MNVTHINKSWQILSSRGGFWIFFRKLGKAVTKSRAAGAAGQVGMAGVAKDGPRCCGSNDETRVRSSKLICCETRWFQPSTNQNHQRYSHWRVHQENPPWLEIPIPLPKSVSQKRQKSLQLEALVPRKLRFALLLHLPINRSTWLYSCISINSRHPQAPMSMAVSLFCRWWFCHPGERIILNCSCRALNKDESWQICAFVKVSLANNY